MSMAMLTSTSENDSSANSDHLDVEMESGMVFTRLNEVVREQYFCFLEKLLKQNYEAWCCNPNITKIKEPQNHIKACAQLLEDKAIKSCMMVQLYRKAMVKIIAKVRRNTEQCRLQRNLRIIIDGNFRPTNNNLPKHQDFQSKSTQTEKENVLPQIVSEKDEFTSLTLKQKMQMFKEKLNRETAEIVGAKTKYRQNLFRSKKKLKQSDDMLLVPRRTDTHKLSFITKNSQMLTIHDLPQPNTTTPCIRNDDCHDAVAQELAQLFSEEKTEIDDIFGFNSSEVPDDPQINIILNEIHNAKLPYEQKQKSSEDLMQESEIEYRCSLPQLTTPNIKEKEERFETSETNKTDLRNSLWPCELYMQRRRLTEALSRLIEEDFRWNEIIKWKFVTLFGEDSDDEFALYSPSIELDEILICSCVKRISPWVVKHLMRPMNDGLIANRFLFKKLAKKLSRGIILENQYPEEKIIKDVVENFFCIHQAVVSAEDLEMPVILYNENI